jgi:hypothetical protein
VSGNPVACAPVPDFLQAWQGNDSKWFAAKPPGDCASEWQAGPPCCALAPICCVWLWEVALLRPRAGYFRCMQQRMQGCDGTGCAWPELGACSSVAGDRQLLVTLQERACCGSSDAAHGSVHSCSTVQSMRHMQTLEE